MKLIVIKLLSADRIVFFSLPTEGWAQTLNLVSRPSSRHVGVAHLLPLETLTPTAVKLTLRSEIIEEIAASCLWYLITMIMKLIQ